MENLDRPGIIALLGRLGAADDQAVLAAARELHRKMSESGSTWDDLIRPQPLAADAGARSEPVAAPVARAAADDSPPGPSGDASAGGRAETARLIERLLARKDLSAVLREELTAMKGSAGDGSLDAMDSRYVRALAKRLGV